MDPIVGNINKMIEWEYRNDEVKRLFYNEKCSFL